MTLPTPTLTRLLGSIEANNLVLLCGAGLSIPSPSDLMSAAAVSNACYEKYAPTLQLPADMRYDVEKLAGHFYSQSLHEFESIFIDALVPWNKLVGEPNPGHEAVGDLLCSNAAQAALSANFDNLVEHWANGRKDAMRGALDGQEALQFAKNGNPLIKFHGCHIRDRHKTLWTTLQLTEKTISDRVNSCANWMKLNLPGKDILVVGFWTDWGYLNDVLAGALSAKGFGSVIVVDPASAPELQKKAPQLWANLTGGSTNFEHIAASGAQALEELRVAFSRVWMKKFYALGKTLVEAEGKTYVAMDPDMVTADLYSCRLDAEGRPYTTIARLPEPPPHAEQVAFFHHLLNMAGASREGPWYVFGGRRIRVLQGAGNGLRTVQENFKEPPAMPQPDIVVCVGAKDLPVHAKLIASGSGASVVRPSSGGSAQWMVDEEARGLLAI